MAVTTIPWGDGSGDNIYLTYSASQGDQTILVSSDANNGEARTKDITFVSTIGNISRVLTVLQESGIDLVSITWNDVCITYNDTAIAYPYIEPYIVFVDSSVEQICATKWGDGVGLKPSQAAQVTNSQFGTTFRANTNITSFDELSYFTGLTQVPGGNTSSAAFYGCTALTSVTLSSTITTLAAYCFQGCSNLVSCPDLSNITTIGANVFNGCGKLSGTVTIPSSVMSLGGTMFSGCNSLQNLIINSTINITTQYISSTTDALCCGDGTGTFYCAGNLTNASNYRAYFRKYIIGGNYTQTGGGSNPWRVKVVNSSWPTEVFVVKGNYSTNGTNAGSSALIRGATNATSKLKFIEIMGTITSSYCILGDMNNNFIASSVILHLGYDAYTNGSVPCTPGIVGASNTRVSKIYVGKGISASEDNNILSIYTSDTNWSAYSGKLDTWYNYINSENANSDFIN